MHIRTIGNYCQIKQVGIELTLEVYAGAHLRLAFPLLCELCVLER
jgi:hypothetical protein